MTDTPKPFIYPTDIQAEIDKILAIDIWPAVSGIRQDYLPIRIDGRVQTFDEIDLFRQGLQKLVQLGILDRNNATFNDLNQTDTFGFFSASTQSTNLPIHNQILKLPTKNGNFQSLNEQFSHLKASIDSIVGLTDDQTLALTYTINELLFAIDHCEGEIQILTPAPMNEALAQWSSPIALIDVGLNPTDIENLNGEVIDVIRAENPRSAPTVIVFLDWHHQYLLAESNMHDIALMQNYNPINTMEGVPYGEDATEFYTTMYWDFDTQGCITELEIQRPKSLDSSFFGSLDRSIPKCAVAVSTYLILNSEKFPDVTIANIRTKIQEALILSGDYGTQVSFRTYASYDIYYKNKIAFVGWENLFTNPQQILNSENSPNDEIQYTLNDGSYILNWRSHAALDNTVNLASGNESAFATLVIGAAHYETLRQYAKDRGDVNVVFIAPSPSFVEMPILPFTP